MIRVLAVEVSARGSPTLSASYAQNRAVPQHEGYIRLDWLTTGSRNETLATMIRRVFA